MAMVSTHGTNKNEPDATMGNEWGGRVFDWLG